MASTYHICLYFSEKPQLIKKAENAIKSSHLLTFNYDPVGVIRARVQASMKKNVYDVKIVLNSEGIASAECSCPVGKALCHHMAVAALHSTSISKTDVACSWTKRKEPDTVRPVSELFGSSNFSAVRRKPDQSDMDWLKNALNDGAYEINHFVNNEFNDETILDFSKYLFDNILKDAKSVTVNKVDFILERLKVNDPERNKIFQETAGQSINFLWGSLRKGRFTASNFGSILIAVRKRKICNTLLKKLLCEEHMKANVKAIQWGSIHEETAMEIYAEVKQCSIDKVGLFLHETGILGCSPDGIIGDDKMIEVKCPHSMIAPNSLFRALTSGKWYLTMKPDVSATCYSSDGISVYEFSEGDVSINLKHVDGRLYYHQIQGNLHLLNREICDFIIWTPSVVLIIPIHKEPSWEGNLTSLINFYKDVFIYQFLK